jgi:8-oxo-dGTP pyrophosphatase MutT (NUDIX family)
MESTPQRRAAVLLLLLEKQDETHIIFTKRTDRVAYHKNQISFPGGNVEASDSSLLQTALRETEEELGITSDQIEILGQLSQIKVATSQYNVTPFVGRLKSTPTYRSDPAEVAEIIEAPISILQDPANYWQEERMYPDGAIQVNFFRYREHIIWGATGRILREFLDKLRDFPIAPSSL